MSSILFKAEFGAHMSSIFLRHILGAHIFSKLLLFGVINIVFFFAVPYSLVFSLPKNKMVKVLDLNHDLQVNPPEVPFHEITSPYSYFEVI